MNVKRSALLIIFCFFVSILGLAQENEVSFSIGAMHSSDQTETINGLPCSIACVPISTSTSTGVGFEGSYGRQLFRFGAASLDFELPVLGVPGRDVKISTQGVTLPVSFSTWTLFLTPSARVKLHAGPVSPFVSVGGGWAHFGTSFSIPTVSIGGIPVPGSGFSSSNGTNHGALQFGGGVDFNTPLPHVAIRAEVRDYWAVGVAHPSSLASVSPEHQHNIFAAGGVVLRF